MMSLDQLQVKIFADGADLAGMLDLYRRSYIQGLTTNPSLMRKAGVASYVEFAGEILSLITDKPVCFEVLADDFPGMEREALEMASWAENVYVKIPITNTHGESCRDTVARLAGRGVKLNVTALMTLAQLEYLLPALPHEVPSFVSIFAGRIADTGIDPAPLMARAVELLRGHPHAELIWASSRELLNIVQADAVGCHIITVTSDILARLPMLGRDLTSYSRDTVRMLHEDGRLAGFHL